MKRALGTFSRELFLFTRSGGFRLFFIIIHSRFLLSIFILSVHSDLSAQIT